VVRTGDAAQSNAMEQGDTTRTKARLYHKIKRQRLNYTNKKAAIMQLFLMNNFKTR
jgi:hypothetical protein